MPRDEEPITSREMRALELNSEYFGVSRLLLMENAGLSVALEVAKRFRPRKTIVAFCGLGGNGGDGFVASRHLSSMGFKVKIIIAGRAREIQDKAASENWQALEFLRETIPVYEVQDSTLVPEIDADIAIDALLGTGTRGELRPPILQLVRKINNMDAFRIAVDVPTGIDSDTGKVLSEAVKADLTITFHRNKKGLVKAKKYAGETVIREIGLPKQFEKFAGPGNVSLVTKTRPSDTHKGDFGRLLIIGGSETFSGAPALVAQAALRTGVDIAYVAAPEKTAYAISSMTSDLITIKLEGKHLNPDNLKTLQTHMESCNAIVLGPGLGLHMETKEAVKAIVDAADDLGKPLLLDADALKAFAEFKKKLDVPLVLTPHAGEYALLTGKKPSHTLAERTTEVERTAASLNATILLKGAVDVVSDGRRVKLNFTGNPGMTVGGTGDVLSGIVGALLAQNVEAFESAVAGAFVNGAAGDFVFEEKGAHMLASDLLKWIPKVLNDPMSHVKVRRTGQ